MIERLKNRISSFFKSALNNKKLSTYAFFLFISFSFWFVSMLSKQHETSLKVPLIYSNLPADKLVADPVSNFVEVRVKAPGFSILFYNLFNFSKLSLDIDKANTKPNKDGSEVFWIMNAKRESVVEIISTSMELLDISPARLVIPFSDRTKKKVAIKLNQSISLKSEMWFENPIILIPDSVMIYGEKQQLDTIDFIDTEELLLTEVSESNSNKVSLSIPDQVQCKTENIEVIIEIEPFVEQLIEYKVRVMNLKKGYTIKLFPKKVQVTVRAPKDKYSMLQTDFLTLKVDASLISADNSTLDVEVENLPSFIQLQRVYPSMLEFLLIKE
ncbi:MAG: YbbR-like domain-containing protein [Flavobacteriales bacterium]|nr:YbbR-like domain-containing protein [Flavobacteriales bacterium]